MVNKVKPSNQKSGKIQPKTQNKIMHKGASIATTKKKDLCYWPVPKKTSMKWKLMKNSTVYYVESILKDTANKLLMETSILNDANKSETFTIVAELQKQVTEQLKSARAPDAHYSYSNIRKKILVTNDSLQALNDKYAMLENAIKEEEIEIKTLEKELQDGSQSLDQ